METRSGHTVPFLEEEKKAKVSLPPRIETQNSSLIPLIDKPCVEDLVGNRLPTRKEVIAYFYHLHSAKKLTLLEAKRKAVQGPAQLWELVSITPKTCFR